MNKHLKSMKMRKYFCIAVSTLLLSVTPTLSQDAPKPVAKLVGPNLVKNAGFEEGLLNWTVPRDTAKVTSEFAHSGKHSLYYANTNVERYNLFSQTLDVNPGDRIRFSVWIKGQDVAEKGASIYIQSYQGTKFLGGSYAGGLKGNFDWKQVTAEYEILPDATETSVGLYLTKNSVGKAATGKVWFDDVDVCRMTPPPFRSFLQYPNYRNIVMQDNRTPWKYKVQINAEADWKDVPVKITNTLTDAAGKVLLEKKSSFPASQQSVTITMNPPANLLAGKYSLRQHITDPNGNVYLADEQIIDVVEEMPTTYIDAQGFTVVDGKRFFPMGLYLHTPYTIDEDMDRIEKGGFNTILTYGYGSAKGYDTYMERAAKYNLKVIYNTTKTTKYTKLMRDKPALLAWYTSDEPHEEDLPSLRDAYRKIQQDDYNHPTFLVQDKIEMMPKHFDNVDIIGADPYPVGSPNLTKTSINTRVAVAAAQGAKGVWIVPQLMDWHVYLPERKMHPPSLDELRNQAYQAIINGATGLIWYSYYDMMYTKSRPRDETTEDMALFHKRWPDVTSMAKEIDQIVPVVLANKKVMLDLPKDAQVEAGAWRDGDILLLMLANPYYQAKTISLNLPQKWKIQEAIQGEIKSTFSNGQVTFTLPSVGSGVFRLVKN